VGRLCSMSSSLARMVPTAGERLANIQTPALIVSKPSLLFNIRRLPALVRERDPAGRVRIRAHFKAHKCGGIAKLQLQEGGVRGLCFQKLSEIEACIKFFEEEESSSTGSPAELSSTATSHRQAAGWKLDLLVTNEVVERSKLRRLCELSLHSLVGRLGLVVDDESAVNILLEEAQSVGAKRMGVAIEIDVGQQRCGLDIESREGNKAFVRLATRLSTAHRDPSCPISFIGLQAYHGANQHVRSASDREKTVRQSTSLVEKAIHLLKASDCYPGEDFLITGGGTGSFFYEASSAVYNEIQPGSYALMDRDYALNMDEEGKISPPFKHSLFILSTVISTAGASRGWVTLDAGLKAYSVDSGLPSVWSHPNLDCLQAGDEHTKLVPKQEGNLDALKNFNVGDRVWLVPGHCDPTVNLYDWIVSVDEDKVDAVWSVFRSPGL